MELDKNFVLTNIRYRDLLNFQFIYSFTCWKNLQLHLVVFNLETQFGKRQNSEMNHD